MKQRKIGWGSGAWLVFGLIVLGGVVSGRADLGTALDNTSLVWNTTPGAPWTEQSLVINQTDSSAQSFAIGDNQTSAVWTTVVGPGRISFWWKVSSEAGFDFLTFRVGGLEYTNISGEVDWVQLSFPISPGTQTLMWTYMKDEQWADGDDAGWLDQVVYTPGAAEPFIARQPQSVSVMGGDAAQFDAIVVGATPMRYQWTFNGTNLPGATNATLYIGFVEPWHQGSYQLIASNSYGVAASVPVYLTVGVNDLALSLNATNLAWVTGGTQPWFAQSIRSRDGLAAQSGPIDDSISETEESLLQTRVHGPGILTFWWRVDSELDADFLEFYIDNEMQAAISGQTDWQQRRYVIGAGTHDLTWRYVKDLGGAMGFDAGWVDEVVFVTASAPRSLGWSNGVFRMQVPTVTGINYALEYRNSLSTGTWVSLPAIAGDGTVKILSDANATNRFRFYRLKIY